MHLHIMIIASFCCAGALAQDNVHAKFGLRFYEKLAQRDASYEHTFQMANHQDEQDYWNDQQNFERHLGTADFTSYLIYMKGKKEAYFSHLRSCDTTCGHSDLYFKKAGEYLSSADFDKLLEPETEEVVQNIPRKKGN
ncbi:hypothetical protein [Flagellimonas onchidii]|uniref:hypothetical protein n=1 Tax=Flagellimonas onchidii TaxID=2562684 RepID=UPI0010A5EA61|nr:hypothetical protein [Allomuricauda onchidii]